MIGASPRRGTIGGELFRNILAGDFTGAAYPVNRGGEAVGGVPGYPEIAGVPVVVDLAVICVPGARALDAVRSALATGVKAICVISAGFAETGADGQRRQDELLALVRAHGARLIGPNCLGVSSNATRLNATFARRGAPAGRIGFSSQSGALGLALLEEADARGLGLSSFVSIGNKADVSSNDLLEYWEDDRRDRRHVALPRVVRKPAEVRARREPCRPHEADPRHAERHEPRRSARCELAHGRARGLRRRGRGAVLAGGRVARTHARRASRRGHVLLHAAAPTRQSRRRRHECRWARDPLRRRVRSRRAVAPAARAETVAALARVAPAESSSANPVDLLGSATAGTYEVALPIVLADPGVDALIVLFVPPVVATAADVAAAIARATVGAEKPVLPVVISADGSPAGSFTYPESAARALGLAARRAAWLRRPASEAPYLDRIDRARPRRSSIAR